MHGGLYPVKRHESILRGANWPEGPVMGLPGTQGRVLKKNHTLKVRDKEAEKEQNRNEFHNLIINNSLFDR